MRRTAAWWLCGAALLLSPASFAQDATDQAKTFFTAGAQAYEAGQFTVAIQAFEEAYRLAPRPGILFSMAQAHRRQYYVDKNPEQLGAAVRRYREYVEKVPQGGRRADAAQALAELEPIASRTGAPAAGEGAAPAASPAKQQTRVMVSSQTKGARVSLDGARAVELTDGPLIAEVKPGKHTVKVSAEGYFDEVQEINAVEGGLVPRDVALRDRPAALKIAAPSGSDVSIDGRPMGTTPLPAPIEVPAGRHFIAVTKNGNHAHSQELELKRGETRTITADLDTTGQRVASIFFFGGGVVSAGTGVVLSLLALREQNQAEAILGKQQQGNITTQERSDYDGHVARRDGLKASAITAFAGGAALGTVGLLLFVFDRPTVTVPAAQPKSDDRPRPTGPRPGEGTMELSAAPTWAPGFAGGTVRGTF
jgi:tetratricopeptide (TPR) repeat protein